MKILFAAVSVLLINSICAIDLRAQAMTDGSGFMAVFATPEPIASINTTVDDYGPEYEKSHRRLLFTTDRSGTTEIWFLQDSTTQPGKALGTFNSDGKHRGYLSYGRSGEVVGVAFQPGERQAYATIITVPLDNGFINEGHPIASLNDGSFTTQPALSPDGTRLVVASNREGGAGGMDLWVCDRRTDLVWSVPVQISDKINSEGDEITPFFVSSDSLVYASNGYGGKGGFDLFLVVLKDGAWQEPEPITFLNSEFNESDLILLPSGSIIFSSDRPGGVGGLDLWITRRLSSSQ